MKVLGRSYLLITFGSERVKHCLFTLFQFVTIGPEKAHRGSSQLSMHIYWYIHMYSHMIIYDV